MEDTVDLAAELEAKKRELSSGMKLARDLKVPSGVEEPKGVGAPSLVHLESVTVLSIELLATKKRLAEANEKLALLALQDAKKLRAELEQEEAALLKGILSKVGVPDGSLRLLDREKGICQIVR